MCANGSSVASSRQAGRKISFFVSQVTCAHSVNYTRSTVLLLPFVLSFRSNLRIFFGGVDDRAIVCGLFFVYVVSASSIFRV